LGRVAVVKFPGTNCDEDVAHALSRVTSLRAEIVWYKDFVPGAWDAVIIPGGFSFGDWLRAGAIAARTAALERIAEEVLKGTPVLGICNGFQILVEAGLLPGALAGNDSGKFTCRWVKLRVERPRGPWLSLASDGGELDMPVAHAEGRYVVDQDTYSKLISEAPLIRYKAGWNPNGSFYDIAGVGSRDGLVLGLMPHPERASEEELVPRGFAPGGRVIFKSLEASLKRGW